MGNIYLIIYYLVYLVAVFTVGSFFLKFFNIKFGSKIEERIFEFALGNIVYSLIFIYLGIFHLLYGKLLLVFYILPSFLLLKRLLFGELKFDIISKIKQFLKHKWETTEVLIFLFFLFIFLPLLPHIFIFPTSWDALAYHLVLPKIYLRDHFFSFYDWFTQTSMPIGIESLFGYGEVLGEPRLSNFIVFTFLIALATYILYGLRYLFSRKVLVLALLLLLYKKMLFSSVSVNPFVDFPFAFYGLVFMMMLNKYFDAQKLVILALVLALALFTFMIKYVLGFVFLFALFAVLIIYLFTNSKDLKKLVSSVKSSRRLFLLSIFFLMIFLIPVLYWLFRNFVYTHNPIYPILNNVFKSFDYNEANYKVMMAEIKRQSLNFDMLRNFLLHLPGNYSIFPEALFSLILIIFPLVGVFRKEKIIKYGALFGLIFSIIVYWWVGFPSYRYVLGIAPILAIVTSYVFFDFFKNAVVWYKIPLITLFVISLVLQLITTSRFEIYFFFDGFRVALKSMMSYKGAVQGLYQQDNYLSIDYVNKNLDKNKDTILAVFDNRLYYFNIPVVFATQMANGLFTDPKKQTIGEIYEEVKKMKITYVFVNNNWGIYPNLRKDLYYPFVENYLEPVSSTSGTIVYRVK